MQKLFALLFSSSFLFTLALIAQPASPQGSDNPSSTPMQNAYAATQINWLKNYSDAVAASKATSKPIVILFTGTNWCPACMQLERQVLQRPEFAQAVGQSFIFLKAEFPVYSENAIASSPYKALLDRYNVNNFPTMIVVNADGQPLYTVDYREGGPQGYIQELLQNLNRKSDIR